MRNIIAIAASLAINSSLVLAFQHSADAGLPKGEVTITELGIEVVPTLAQAAHDQADRVAL